MPKNSNHLWFASNNSITYVQTNMIFFFFYQMRFKKVFHFAMNSYPFYTFFLRMPAFKFLKHNIILQNIIFANVGELK